MSSFNQIYLIVEVRQISQAENQTTNSLFLSKTCQLAHPLTFPKPPRYYPASSSQWPSPFLVQSQHIAHRRFQHESSAPGLQSYTYKPQGRQTCRCSCTLVRRACRRARSANVPSLPMWHCATHYRADASMLYRSLGDWEPCGHRSSRYRGGRIGDVCWGRLGDRWLLLQSGISRGGLRGIVVVRLLWWQLCRVYRGDRALLVGNIAVWHMVHHVVCRKSRMEWDAATAAKMVYPRRRF